MSIRASDTFVGAFVLSLSLALIGGVLWLTAKVPGRETASYVVYMTESVSGLSKDASVKYRGVDVGRVNDVDLDPDNPERVRILLEVQAGTPIKEDTVAELEMQGLTGLAFINLSGGTRESPLLKARPGEAYPALEGKRSALGGLDKSLPRLVENVNFAVKRIEAFLSEDNRQSIAQTLQNLQTVTAALSARSESLGQALDDLAETLRTARGASGRLPELVSDARAGAVALKRAGEELASGATAVKQTAEVSGRDLRRFTSETLPEITALVDELRQAAGNFRRLSDALERDPRIILFGPPKPKPGPGE